MYIDRIYRGQFCGHGLDLLLQKDVRRRCRAKESPTRLREWVDDAQAVVITNYILITDLILSEILSKISFVVCKSDKK